MLDYLTQPDEKENECYYCGYECYNTYCGNECKKADYYENCTD